MCHEILYKFWYLKNGKYATPIIRLLVWIISDFKVSVNYLSDLDEIFQTNQLKDNE